MTDRENQLPSVSVVMPCFNARRFLADAISSALAQTVPPMEVIVVDDGSSDGSEAEARRFGPPVFLHTQRNAGPSAARNVAVQFARGTFVAFLDADDTWEPNKLDLQLQAIQSRPEVVLCHTQMRFIDDDGRPGGLGWGGTYTSYEQMLLGCGICTSSVLVRRDALLRAGPFDRRFEPAEDYDLWLRLARLGPMVAIDQPLVRYRLHESNLSRNYLRTHQAIIRVLTEQMNFAKNEKNADHVRALRRGFRRTKLSTARHAMFAMVDAWKSGAWKSSLGHLAVSAAMDPALIPVEFFTRAFRKFKRPVNASAIESV